MSRKSVLLYQHVTAHCICRFTQALLCNVSEAIHMLYGVLQCRHGQEPLISICDSGGKSDLVFGLASLLNILLYPASAAAISSSGRPPKRNRTRICPASSPALFVGTGWMLAGRT